MSSSSRADRTIELSPVATVGLITGFAVAGWLGYTFGGIAGAFFAAVSVTTVAGVSYVAVRARANDRTRLAESSAPNVEGLPPAQALSMMGAMMGEGGASPFRSELLGKLADIDETLTEDPSGALDALAPFLQDHARSPAVHLRVARAHRAQGEDDRAAASASTALRNALDGGMNPMAASIFEEFEALRERFDLEPRHHGVLAKVLQTRGLEAAADWCRTAANA
ncbi:MAG: hypothetical protein AAGA54_07790 [Myxococcota bacterium]